MIAEKQKGEEIMKIFRLSKKIVVFSITTIVLCLAMVGTGVVLAYTEYDSPYVHESGTFKKWFMYGFTTNTGETVFNYDTVIEVSATNKTAKTGVSFPHGYIAHENDCSIYVYSKVRNNNGNVTKTNDSSSITLGLSGNYERIVSTPELGFLAYAGYSEHIVELSYFTGDDALLGADVHLYYR